MLNKLKENRNRNQKFKAWPMRYKHFKFERRKQIMQSSNAAEGEIILKILYFNFIFW